MRIGKYTVPEVRIYPNLVEATRLAYERFGEKPVEDLDELARLLGHTSAKSGAFLLKLAALRSYGLLEGRGEGKIRVSEVGRDITHPPGAEAERKALEKTVASIPLWRELYTKFGLALPAKNLSPELAGIASCTLQEAEAKEDWVRRAYGSDVTRMKSLGRLGGEMPAAKLPTPPGEAMTPPSRFVELRLGDIFIHIRPTLEDLEAARGLLDLLERRLKGRPPETPH